MRAALLAAVGLLAACAGPRLAGTGSAPAARAQSWPQAPEVRDPNFVLIVSEAVPNPEKDGVSFTKVFVDGKELGKTAIGPRSETRTLKLKLPAGNQPVRFEQWSLPSVGEWERLAESSQPRERFVRVDDESIARVELRFSEGEITHMLTVSRFVVAR